MSFRFLFSFLFICVFSVAVFSDQTFSDRDGREIHLIPVKSIEDIDQQMGKEILVKAFMSGYEDVPLSELNPEFKSTGDVRRFYQDYFDSEFAHYKNGELIWVQAFDGETLVGFATFELEDSNAAYMNLLVVDPQKQGKGIGQHLTFSIQGDDLCPSIQEIRLFIRKVNESGRKFYERIGFSDFEYKRQDNFVDMVLLTGLRWVSQP